MHNDFTVHCIPWHSAALLLQEVRVAANGMERQASSPMKKLLSGAAKAGIVRIGFVTDPTQV